MSALTLTNVIPQYSIGQSGDTANMIAYDGTYYYYSVGNYDGISAIWYRFARTGGEANAIAIRIARAASGRDKVAICGYHGWHDWYLAANLSQEKNLDGHLLPGLEPNGVPRGLAESVFPFRYNDFEGLQELVRRHDIGVIKMEVVRNIEPENNFLAKIRELATQNNIVRSEEHTSELQSH